MSPEYRVSLALPYVFIVTAEDEREAKDLLFQALEERFGPERAQEAFEVEVAKIDTPSEGTGPTAEPSGGPVREVR